MISPSVRLLWLVALLVVPAVTLVGLNIAYLPICALFVLLFAAASAFDVWQLSRLIASVEVTSPSSLKWFKDRQSIIALRLSSAEHVNDVQVSLALPAHIRPASEYLTFDLPAPAELDFLCTPTERGRFLIRDCLLNVASPWQCWHGRASKRLNLEIRVFPDLAREKGAKALFLLNSQGIRTQRIVGRGRELERLREYAPGDSFDEIYWKATARRSSPITKVFQVERTQDVYAIVDGSRLGARNQALERFVSAALLLGLAAEKQGDNFGLVRFADRVHKFIRASRGKGHFNRCREAIYDLQPDPVSPDFEELFTFLTLQIRKRSLLLFLTDLGDPILSESFARDVRLVTRRHVTVVNQIADPEDRPLFSGPTPGTVEQIGSRLVGHLQWVKHRELAKNLGLLGVRMHLLKPESASVDLIQQYLEIKQRQLL